MTGARREDTKNQSLFQPTAAGRSLGRAAVACARQTRSILQWWRIKMESRSTAHLVATMVYVLPRRGPAQGGDQCVYVCVCVLISRDDMFALCPDAKPCVCQHPSARKPKFISLSCWYVGSPAVHDSGPRFVLSMCVCVCTVSSDVYLEAKQGGGSPSLDNTPVFFISFASCSSAQAIKRKGRK